MSYGKYLGSAQTCSINFLRPHYFSVPHFPHNTDKHDFRYILHSLTKVLVGKRNGKYCFLWNRQSLQNLSVVFIRTYSHALFSLANVSGTGYRTLLPECQSCTYFTVRLPHANPLFPRGQRDCRRFPGKSFTLLGLSRSGSAPSSSHRPAVSKSPRFAPISAFTWRTRTRGSTTWNARSEPVFQAPIGTKQPL